MAILKRALIVLGIILLVPVVVLAAALFYLSTAQGLSTIASLTSKYASSDDTKIAIGGIEGSFPYDLTLKNVRLSDRKGEWLTLDRARLLWSPLQLYSRKLVVNLVDVGEVKVARQPDYPEQNEPAAPVDPNAPWLPELPIEIHLEKFLLTGLDLATPVIGTPAKLAASAAATLRKASDGVSAEFEFKRIDSTPGRIGGKARFIPATNGIEISLRGSEPAGGLVARMANIPGLPPIDIGLDGAGTLDALRAQLAIVAGDQGRIDGAANVTREGKARRVTLGVNGDVGKLVDPSITPLVEGMTKISAEALVPDQGPIDLLDATIDAPSVRLAARGKIDADAETVDLSYDVKAGDPARFAALLPPGTRWASLGLLGTAKGPLDHPVIDATIDGGALASAQGQAETARIKLHASPNGALSDDKTRVAFTIDADADGVKFADDRMFALGRTLNMSAAGVTSLKGEATIDRSEVRLADVAASYAGAVSPQAAKGRAALKAGDLATIAPLTGMTLSGAVDLASDFDLAYDLSRLSASLNGSAKNLQTGIAQLDSLTGGSLAVRGGVSRGDDGAVTIRGLDARGDHIVVTADGAVTKQNANVTARAEVDDLARLDTHASGRAIVDAALTGRLDNLGVKSTLSVPDGQAMGKPLKELKLDIDATDVTGSIGATAGLGGMLDGKPLRGGLRLVTEDNGTRRIENIDLAIASTTAKGGVSVTPQGLATGRVTIDAPDLAEVGALALTELAGRLNADVALSVDQGRQRAAIQAKGSDIVAAGARVGALDVAATVVDPTGKLTLDGTVNGTAIAAGGQAIDTLSLIARGAPDGMDVSLKAGAKGSSAAADGRVVYAPSETRIDLSRLDLTGGGKSARLAGPAKVRVAGSDIAIEAFSLRATDGGLLSVKGKAGDKLDLDVALRELPLALGNAFSPDLGLGGFVEGDAKVTGTSSAPQAVFDIRGSELSLAQLRDAKVPPLTLAAKGRLEGDRVTTDATVSGAGGLSIVANGSAPLGQGDLDMTVALRSVPLALANAFAPDLGLRGALRGDVRVTGPIDAPIGRYDLRIAELQAALASGLPPLDVTTRGALEGRHATTETTVTGGGIDLVASGAAPLGDGPIDLTVNLRGLPLKYANAFAPGVDVEGAMRGVAHIGGAAKAPAADYDITIADLISARAKGVPPLRVTARGATDMARVTTDAQITGGGGIDAAVKGSAPLGDGDLDMAVAISKLPLALVNAFVPDLGVDGSLRGNAKLGGPVAKPVGTYDLAIDGLTAAQAKGAPPLKVAAKGALQGDRVTTDTTITGQGGVNVVARGSAPLGQGDLDMAVAIRELPLALANSFQPSLGISGKLQGDATVKGPIGAPRGSYDLTISDLLTSAANGVPALQVATTGELQGSRVTTDTSITGGGGIQATAKGSAPLGQGDLDMAVAIQRLPLALANAIQPSLGLGGELRGQANVAGPLDAPRGTYDLAIDGLTAAQAKGVPALAIVTKGTLEGQRVTTDTSVTGGGGINLSAKGSAPLGASGDIDMVVAIREIPLAIADAFSPGLGLRGKVQGDAKVAGTISAPQGSYDISVVDLSSAQAKGVAPLLITTRGTLEGQRVTTDTAITGGGVRATAKGAVPLGNGDIDVDIDVPALPLAIANGFMPSLGLGGSLTGKAKVGGPLTAPTGDYDFRVVNLTSAQAKGAPALQIATKGGFAGGRVTTDTAITGGGGVRVTANGSAPLGSTGDLDLTVALRSVPLALANGFSPGLGANGTLAGDAKIGGAVAAPTGTYSLKVTGLSTAATRSSGVPVAQIDAKGALQGKRVTTDTVVAAASGLRVTARGSAPLGAGDLDLAVAGRAPLAFLNNTLSVSGDRIDGVATFDVKVGGPTSAPRINGSAELVNATYFNRAAGLQLRGLSASIAATGANIDIRSLRATTRNGGSISGSGRVAVNPDAGFPGEIRFSANNAEVVGTDIVTAITDADLRLSGPLARRPVVTGTIRTRSVEIQIPDKIPARYTPLPDVRQKNAPPAVLKQRGVVNAGKKSGKADDAFAATLDIDVQANDRIFIRGLGMNAEAGGQIKITGTSANPVPVGAFQLRQGRSQISVAGKRLEFTRGAVAFAGDLDPTLDFVAETQAKDITAQVLITGTASSPQINFGSNPSVPTDEVLARLLFNKSSGELSPSQAISLAQTVAQYSGVGGGGGGPLEGLRKGLGVDSLDIASGGGDGGLFGLGIGRYISDNIYLGFATGTSPEDTGVTVDIDLTNNIKARGQAGAAGNASAGVAAEWDY